MRSILLSILFAAAACGGKSDTEATTPAPETETHVEEKHEGHPELTAEMHAFHDKLAPLWHAEAGAQRQTDTCAAVPDLQAAAKTIADAAPPAGVEPAAWTAQVTALDSSITDLGASCTGADFEAKFSVVHDQFHALMELLPKPAA